MAEQPRDAREDLEFLRQISAALIDAVREAADPWVRAAVAKFLPPPWSQELDAAVADAAAACREDLVHRLSDLFAIDIADQASTPLVILRSAHRWPTEVLAAAGVDSIRRDPFDVRMDPDDRYGLAPNSWADFGEGVAEPGLMWGAAKAHLHLRRRAAP